MITSLRSTFARLHTPMLSPDEAQRVADHQLTLTGTFTGEDIAKLVVVRRAVLAGYYNDGGQPVSLATFDGQTIAGTNQEWV